MAGALVTHVEPLDDADPGVGARYRDDWEIMGLSGHVVNEVTGFEPPRNMTWTQVDESGSPTRTVADEAEASAGE